MNSVPALEPLVRDLRYAFRMLRKTPGFTVVALLTLAVGIGVNTAVFTVVNTLLLKPLPFPDPDRLVMVFERPPRSAHNNVVQTQNFLDWRRRNRSYVAVAPGGGGAEGGDGERPRHAVGEVEHVPVQGA